jgi:hypothetical protein
MLKQAAEHHATMLFSAMALVQNPTALRTMRDDSHTYEDEYETLDPTKGGSVVPPKSE